MAALKQLNSQHTQPHLGQLIFLHAVLPPRSCSCTNYFTTKDLVQLALSSHTAPVCLPTIGSTTDSHTRSYNTLTLIDYPRQWLPRQLDLTYSQYPPKNLVSQYPHCSSYWITPRQRYNSLTVNLTSNLLVFLHWERWPKNNGSVAANTQYKIRYDSVSTTLHLHCAQTATQHERGRNVERSTFLYHCRTNHTSLDSGCKHTISDGDIVLEKAGGVCTAAYCG